MKLSFWILIGVMPKASQETSLWGVWEGDVLELFCYFYVLVMLFLNKLTLILQQLLKLFPLLPLRFYPVKEV